MSNLMICTQFHHQYKTGFRTLIQWDNLKKFLQTQNCVILGFDDRLQIGRVAYTIVTATHEIYCDPLQVTGLCLVLSL